jgi:plastocyanin
MNRRHLLILFATVGLITLPLFVHAKSKPVTVHVNIKGMKYDPASVTIKAGDTVTWTNGDQRDHTVVASDGSFSSGNIGPGATYSFAFSKAGKFEYACSLHPRMKGVVEVK